MKSLVSFVIAAVVTSAEGHGASKGKPQSVINATLCFGCGHCVDVCQESRTLGPLSYSFEVLAALHVIIVTSLISPNIHQ